jgi:hypothetical protein
MQALLKTSRMLLIIAVAFTWWDTGEENAVISIDLFCIEIGWLVVAPLVATHSFSEQNKRLRTSITSV